MVDLLHQAKQTQEGPFMATTPVMVAALHLAIATEGMVAEQAYLEVIEAVVCLVEVEEEHLV